RATSSPRRAWRSRPFMRSPRSLYTPGSSWHARSTGCDPNAITSDQPERQRQALRQPAGGESGTVCKSRQRAEAVGGRQPDEVQARDRAREIPVEGRCPIGGRDLLVERLGQEWQPADLGPVPGRRDHMVRLDGARLALGRFDMQSGAGAPLLDAPDVEAQVQGKAPDDAILHEPPGRRSQVPPHDAQSEGLRHRVEDEWRIGAQTRAPADSET